MPPPLAGLSTLAFRPAGRGGARPGAPFRTAAANVGNCPVHVTALDGLPGLRRAAFVRAFREVRGSDDPGKASGGEGVDNPTPTLARANTGRVLAEPGSRHTTEHRR